MSKATIFGFLFNFTAQETESGHGIMEEPELTLVSTSDISIAEMDFANLTLEEKENEAKCFQVSFIVLINNKYTSFIQPPIAEKWIVLPHSSSIIIICKVISFPILVCSSPQ